MSSGLEQVLFSHRRTVFLLFGIVSLVMAWSALHLRVDAGFTKLVPLGHPYMTTYLEHQAEFGGADRIVLALTVKDGDIFTPSFFATLRQATDAMFFLPGIDRTQVFSILTPNVRFLEVVEDGISGGNVLPVNFAPDEIGFATIRKNIIKAGLVGRLVANEFTGAMVSARLQEFHPETGERLDYLDVARKLEAIRHNLASTSDTGIEVHIIGFAKMVGDIASGAGQVAMFFGIAFLVTALLIYAYTREWHSTMALLGCSLLAVLWQLGLLNLLGFGIDPMSILVPFLIFAIGVSHGVQVVSAMQNEQSRTVDRMDAVRKSFRLLILPGCAALASDVVGFVTISLIDVQIIREIATAAGIGVAAILLTNLILLPVLLSFGSGESLQHPRLELPYRIRSWLSRVAEPRMAAVVIGFWTLLVGVGAWFATEVRIGDEHPGVPELRPDSVYNRDAWTISEHFHIGVDVLTVIGKTQSEGCIEYGTMTILDDFEWAMSRVEGVQSVSGLAGTTKRLHAAWNEGNLKWQTLPRNRYSLVQSVSSVQTSSGLLNADCSVMPVYIYTSDHKAETIQRIVDAVRTFDANNPASPITFQLAAGNLGVMAATNEEVAESQFAIVGYVFSAVIILCLAAFRSVRAVLCIVLPLAAVSVLAYALMAILEIGLKISTLPVVALGVAVGVDYGIYVYSRMHGYLRQGMEYAQAYHRTLTNTGTGVMLTGLTLAAGVATWIFAPLQFQADMGTILLFMFLVNMIGAIVLLPALGSWLFRDAHHSRENQ